jgi:hypothetical protein
MPFGILYAMPPHTETEILRLLEENTVLVKENNVLLKKLRRNGLIDIWLRVVWYAILIGLPFALYFYILEPYLRALGISSEKPQMGLDQFPAFKAFQSMFGGK